MKTNKAMSELLLRTSPSGTCNYPEKSFIIVVSCDVDGSEAVIRFYLSRTDEPSWLNENNLENYKHEAILFLKVSQ